MKHEDVFLKHILDEIDFLLKESKGLVFEEFMEDEVLKRACARSLEIIGEAAKNISPELKKKHRTVDWKKISGLRDKIIHHYFGVDWNIVWDVLKEKLPELRRQIKAILKEKGNRGRGFPFLRE